MKKTILLISLLLLIFQGCSSPPGQVRNLYPVSSLRVCSQNVHRFSERGKKWSRKKQNREEKYLISRMYKAKCDIVALQEVIGNNRSQAIVVAQKLASSLSKRRGVEFNAIVGQSRDRFIRNAILYRSDVLELKESFDLSKTKLPRLQYAQGAGGHFARGPLFALFRLSDQLPNILVATMHFKSRLGAYRDGYGQGYEVLRMEMAQGLREYLDEYLEKSNSGIVPVILGDRNSTPESASAAILRGDISLKDFRNNRCELSESGAAKCRDYQPLGGEFIGLFSSRKANKSGSYKFRGSQSLIDEILLRREDLNLVIGPNNRPRIGLVGKFFKGSDHKLLWAELTFRDRKDALSGVGSD